MNVVNVSCKVVFVAQCVLPIAPLPNPPFTFASTARRNSLTLRQGTRKHRFYQPPTQGEVCVSFRQCPNSMEVIWQHHGRLDREWVSRLRVAKRGPQRLDMISEEARATVGQIDREEIGAAWNEVTPIVRHRSWSVVCRVLARGDGFSCAQPNLRDTGPARLRADRRGLDFHPACAPHQEELEIDIFRRAQRKGPRPHPGEAIAQPPLQ
jgi:hypothetical protein